MRNAVYLHPIGGVTSDRKKEFVDMGPGRLLGAFRNRQARPCTVKPVGGLHGHRTEEPGQVYVGITANSPVQVGQQPSVLPPTSQARLVHLQPCQDVCKSGQMGSRHLEGPDPRGPGAV